MIHHRCDSLAERPELSFRGSGTKSHLSLKVRFVVPQLLLCEQKSSAEVHKEEKNSFGWSLFAADATHLV